VAQTTRPDTPHPFYQHLSHRLVTTFSPPSHPPHIPRIPSQMAYLICRSPRFLTRVSSISTLSSTCLRANKPSVGLIHRALTTASVDPAATDTPIDESLLPQPIDRSYERPEVTRARLVYQSRKRGILETDLLLSTFASKHLSAMSVPEMQEYDKVCFFISGCFGLC
jgi:Flavinator of succinate dehydrogenase